LLLTIIDDNLKFGKIALPGLEVTAAVPCGCLLKQCAARERWSRECGSPLERVSDFFVSLEETGEIRAADICLTGDLVAASEHKTNAKEVMKQMDKNGSSMFPG